MAASTEQKKVTVTFETVDWTSKEQVIQLFPSYVQEKIRVERDKGVSNVVSIENFTLQTPFKDQTLLSRTHLLLEPHKRHCLFGRNGTGKTLLFERMADGTIAGFPAHLHVHHCKEMDHKENPETVLDTVINSHPFMQTLRKCDAKLKQLLQGEPENKAALKEVHVMVENYLRSSGSENAEENVKKMLRALGFDDFGMARSFNDLSGGLRMRVALAVAFFSDADLLLMDEPTNHLDFPSVLWLENRLRAYRGSFLLVTHDRDLLINVTTSVLLIEELQIKIYNCGYAEFEKRKAKEDATRDQEVEAYIKKNRNPDPSTPIGRRVHDMRVWQDNYHAKLVQMAGKFTFPAPTPLPPAPGAVALPDGSISLIKLEKVRFSYNAAAGLPYIFDEPISFEVTTNSRVGIMGPNGAGKSTLLKLLTKKIVPTEGSFSEHPNFVLAYFGQHSTAELQMDLTPLEFMQTQFPGVNSGMLRNHLAKTGVTGGVESTRMQNLSYSQRSCVIFSKLTYVCPHLLIMDEPTNFLDLESVDSLIAAANKFPGALLVVTHSRHFLRKCAKSFLSVTPGQFLSFTDMKEAESATYTFIQELESGVKIDASAMAAGGGSLHAKAQTDAPAVAIHVAEAKPPKYEVGQEVQALWTDKKYYPASIVAVVSTNPVKYSVMYPVFNKKANVPEAGIKEAATVSVAKAAALVKKEEAEAKAKLAAEHKFTAGERVLCMKADGRFYAAKIVKVNGFDMFAVQFEKPVEDATVPLKKLRIYDEADVTQVAAPKPKGKPAAAAAAKPRRGAQRQESA
jgi:ATPase subunit of ABC transporter with duplicated ATPase domains